MTGTPARCCPSLFELAAAVLRKHVGAIGNLGAVPVDLIAKAGFLGACASAVRPAHALLRRRMHC